MERTSLEPRQPGSKAPNHMVDATSPTKIFTNVPTVRVIINNNEREDPLRREASFTCFSLWTKDSPEYNCSLAAIQPS